MKLNNYIKHWLLSVLNAKSNYNKNVILRWYKQLHSEIYRIMLQVLYNGFSPEDNLTESTQKTKQNIKKLNDSIFLSFALQKYI